MLNKTIFSIATVIMLLTLYASTIRVAAATEAAASKDASVMERFTQGVTAYSDGDYTTAQNAFLELIESGIVNGDLFYNLGNAYLKGGDIGRGILWYERAKRLAPGSPDLAFNLAYAKSLTVDRQEEKTPPLTGVIFFWRNHVSSSTVQWSALVINALLWGVLTVAAWRPSKPRNTLRAVTVTIIVAVMGVACLEMAHDARGSDAIILAEKAPIRAGLHDDDTELFTLHAGAKVRIRKKQADRYQIQFAADKLGWVNRAAVGRI
jgi:tetratricopeptide (TPR) repeat protein